MQHDISSVDYVATCNSDQPSKNSTDRSSELLASYISIHGTASTDWQPLSAITTHFWPACEVSDSALTSHEMEIVDEGDSVLEIRGRCCLRTVQTEAEATIELQHHKDSLAMSTTITMSILFGRAENKFQSPQIGYLVMENI